MGALGERLLEAPARDDPAHMRGVVEEVSADLVGDLARLAHGIGKETERARERNHLGLEPARVLAQAVEIDRHPLPIIGHGMRLETVEPGDARAMMRDVAAHLRREGHDAVARLRGRHEGIKVRERARAHADLGVGRLEEPLHQRLRHHLDLAGELHAHLVLVAGIAQRRPIAERAREQRRGARVYHIGAGIEPDALAVHVPLVRVDKPHHLALDRVGVLGDEPRLHLRHHAPAIGGEPGLVGSVDGHHRPASLAKPLADVVMRGLVPRIHAFFCGQRIRGWPEQVRPGRQWSK